MTKKQAVIITSLSLVSLVLALLICARQGGPLWFRIDLTRGHAYTISKVSRNLYQEIDDQVRLTYYLSDELSTIYPQPGEIEDLLREYAAYSHGKIRFETVDPAKKGLEQAITNLGIPGQQIQTVKQNKAEVSIVFTGILIEYLDKSDVIPVAFSPETLEYDLTSRIRALVRERERTLGVLVGDPSLSLQSNFKLLNQVFTQSGYKLRTISAGEEIPSTLNALFVLGGVEELDDWDLYRLDAYIRGGGRALFAVDNFAINLQYGVTIRKLDDKGLLAMLENYGAQVSPSLVLDVSAQTTTVQTTGADGIPMIRIMRYPFWLSVLEETGSSEHPVTSGFAGLDLFWASPLELDPPAGVEGSALFSTTERAWLETSNFSIDPNQDYLFTLEREDTQGVKTLGAALSGVFPSYFAGKDKPVHEGSEEELPDLAENAQAARIIIVGDSDIAGDSYNQQNQRNMAFLVQAADWLGNDDDIVGIRNRAPATGRLDSILDETKRAAAMTWSTILNVVIVPLLVIAAGLFRSAQRRSRIRRAEHEA